MIHHIDDAKFSRHLHALPKEYLQKGSNRPRRKKKIKCVVHKLAGRVLSDLPDSSNDLRLMMASEMSN